MTIPYTHPERPDYLCMELPGGGYLGWPAGAQPEIYAHHVDGPILTMRNGEIHWLTWWERFLFRLGRVEAASLERKYRPDLCRRCTCHPDDNPPRRALGNLL
jgi:hypothetical protein